MTFIAGVEPSASHTALFATTPPSGKAISHSSSFIPPLKSDTAGSFEALTLSFELWIISLDGSFILSAPQIPRLPFISTSALIILSVQPSALFTAVLFLQLIASLLPPLIVVFPLS